MTHNNSTYVVFPASRIDVRSWVRLMVIHRFRKSIFDTVAVLLLFQYINKQISQSSNQSVFVSVKCLNQN